jgi:curved DNA-binding protein
MRTEKGTVMEFKDYYKNLEVDESATQEDIQKAYRKLARKYHPDVNPGDENALVRFKDINEAYQVLLDPEARAKYNRLAASWHSFTENHPATTFDWEPWVSGFDAGSDGPDLKTFLERQGEKETAGLSVFFRAIFGDMEVGKKGDTPDKGEDYNQQVEISLAEAFSGTSRILRVGGRRLEVRIPKGAATGTKVRVRGEGGISPDGTTKGDLYLEIVVSPHPSYRQEGQDLHLDLPVNLYTAILGGEVIVPLLHGKIKLKIPSETQSGRVFRLKGHGMPAIKNPDQRGDLYARVMITIPENLTEEEIELFEELADLRGL